MSILVLISGVVLLTHKKPEPVTGKIKSTSLPRRRRQSNKKNSNDNGNADEEDANEGEQHDGEDQVLWAVGNASDEEDDYDDGDEDIDHHQHPLHRALPSRRMNGSITDISQNNSRMSGVIDEQTGLVGSESYDTESDPLELHRISTKEHNDAAKRRRSMDPFKDVEEQELSNISSQAGRS